MKAGRESPLRSTHRRSAHRRGTSTASRLVRRPWCPVPNRAVHRVSASDATRVQIADASDSAHVLSLRALRARRGVELDTLVVVEALVALADECGEVDEHVLASVVGRAEAEALFTVEPFDSALRHF